MLDIAYIRQHKEIVIQAAKNKNREVDIDRLLEADEERKELIAAIDAKRAQRNKVAKAQGDHEQARKEGKNIKEELKVLEEKLRGVEETYMTLMLQVPNVPDESVPIGADASGNKEIKQWGEPQQFPFPPKDHLQLAKDLDLVDFERGAKVGGSRAYFLKNEAALLEFALLWYTLQKLVQKGYTPMIAPSLVKEFAFMGIGQFPWGREEVYTLPKDNVFLAGTAEVPVTSYFAQEVLEEKNLPKKFVAFSPCFRREAGSYGKDTKGLYRLHQFSKIEQVIIAPNNTEQSLQLHEELLRNSEEVLQDLQLPYRVLLMCTGDMGEPQVKKYDIETWMPSRGTYGETMSNSFMGEFQARRLGIRYRSKDGTIQYCHTLNNTAVASPRILIAILENYQESNGAVRVPDVLQPLVGKARIVPR